MDPDLRQRIEHIRGLASGEGGDEASKNDPWNALTTIVINCDELLAATPSTPGLREALERALERTLPEKGLWLDRSLIVPFVRELLAVLTSTEGEPDGR